MFKTLMLAGASVLAVAATSAEAGPISIITTYGYWTAPSAGVYRVEVWGAQGGFSYTGDGTYTGFAGGYGAGVWADFKLGAGQKLLVIPGQHGGYGYPIGGERLVPGGGGGGGGSAVIFAGSNPAVYYGVSQVRAYGGIVAGGGGGGGANGVGGAGQAPAPGGPGGNGLGAKGVGLGGINGGTGTYGRDGAPGGGLLYDAGAGRQTGGSYYKGNSLGGCFVTGAGCSVGNGGNGGAGFGGGAAGADGGGGGGGFSGGGGGGYDALGAQGGGGGGSYVFTPCTHPSTSNPCTLNHGGDYHYDGPQGVLSTAFNQDGLVEIFAIPAPEPSQWMLMILGMGFTAAMLRRERNRRARAGLA